LAAIKKKKKAVKKTAKKAKPAKKAAKKKTSTRKSIRKKAAKPPEKSTRDEKTLKAKATPTGSTAETMAKRQREISVSEFFAKNRHLLGFDNPRKALLTTVKEAVDNALDACEEARILPEVLVAIHPVGENRFRVEITDNGPGILKSQIPNIFGKLLYGSKFHRLKMSRGQQGIGISAAGMYGLMTTGKPVEIISRTSPRKPAHFYKLQIDTAKNRPIIVSDEEIDWEFKQGTKVSIELEGRHQKGRQSVYEYLKTCAIVNPHARIKYVSPEGEEMAWDRGTKDLPHEPAEIKPHPYGIELGTLINMLRDTRHKSVSAFMQHEFSRVSPRVAKAILETAEISLRAYSKRIGHAEAERLYKAIQKTKIMAPATNCLSPIGEDALLAGLKQVIQADYYAVASRPPSVYRGNPFQIEAAIAYGGDAGEEEGLVRVMRFANRVPLLYQQSACATFRGTMETGWKNYGLSQSRGALPSGPAVILVHVASVWVPFTSESKEAIAHYPEIIKEIKLALQEVGRKIGVFIKRRRKAEAEHKKRQYIEQYIPYIGEALQDILGFTEKEEKRTIAILTDVLEKSRKF